jgi:hypothetical protein
MSISGQELIYQYPNGDVIVNVVAVYMSREFSGELKANKEEGHEIRFFKLSELPQNLSPPDKPVIERYCQSLDNICHMS